MHDIKFIRENPEAFDAGLKRRGLEVRSAELLAIDAERRRLMSEAQEIQARRNKAAKEIGAIKSKGGDASAIMAQVAADKEEEELKDAAAKILNLDLENALLEIPNLPASDVPDGKDETKNKLLRTSGEPPSFDFKPKAHDELGVGLGLMDFDAAAKLSGARFVVLKGALARLERALGAFMLNLHTGTNGYLEVNPPVLVKDTALYGTGQLPKFGDDLFRTEQGHWMIPTAEVPLTNLVSGEILDDAKLPIRMTALTNCFRSEAGAAGKDTRGMIRQHQFQKVELVSITTPEQSEEEHNRMLNCAEEVLKRLGLAYRVITLCTGDMGFSARKTYDIEVWLPAQNAYREISSCSNCGEFQALRMKARCRKAGEKTTRPVHTLNGSGLAVGRTLVAVLENYQQADGSIVVPEALKHYMGGLEVIKP
ncbi:seryl-tRNA synthetase, also charges selenocysteinyl-tRNA with serine [Rhodospirillaceae bacterium LM-1]|nr:seryl-tRNA synthetase, also charges selenocysteinyl-tRNA with serine [Rhodospirillaceae bacterium LM-1]